MQGDRDAAGTVVYDKALMPSLSEPTAAGVAGAWQVQMTLTSYSGTLNFGAETLIEGSGSALRHVRFRDHQLVGAT